MRIQINARKFSHALTGPYMLAVVPLLVLGAYRIGGEAGLLGMALVLPILLTGLYALQKALSKGETDELTGMMLRDGLVEWAEQALPGAARRDRHVAVIALTIDDLDDVEDRFGLSMREKVLAEASQRVRALLRDDDVMARLGPGFAIGLPNVREPETETLLMLAERLKAVFEEPFSEGPTRTYSTMSMGIAADTQVKGRAGANIVAGAQRASELAAVSGPGSVRFYNEGLSSQRGLDRDVARELANALETGEVFVWFQPQVRTDSGGVLGFEALARWEHPERGMISPASFLPDIEKAGLSQRLAEVALKQSLMALNTWDAAGFRVPCVSVNFSSEELRNPRMPDYVRWELDRHGIDSARLVIEVLESVASEANEEIVARTLTSLARIGCRIDLDDFGTGFTSFMCIRRFDVGRIKIDRSLVSHVDRDEDQFRMMAALLAFSEKLGIDALAEGVETEGEVEALRTLGCHQMQGFVTARPMPLGDTLLWLEQHGKIIPPESGSAIASSA